VVQLGQIARQLEPLGVKTLGVVATDAERARVYFRFRRPGMPIGADPDLSTHRAYGLPNMPPQPEMWDAVERAAVRELRLPAPPADGAYAQLGRFDGYQVSEEDQADFARHQAQFTGHFLLDRTGIVRWSYVECARDGLEGIDRLPPAEEVLAAARVL
jgi:hypothetical protein